jgi:NADPH-dependent curcumin reductase CurA
MSDVKRLYCPTAAIRELGQWVKEGKLKYAEEVVEGLERAPEYLNMLFTGARAAQLTHTTRHTHAHDTR